MSLSLSAVVTEEKNKLHNGESLFFIALEIAIPGVLDPIRVVSDNQDMTWRGATWVAFPFDLDEIRDIPGEAPSVNLKVGNASRQMEAYVHNHDAYTKTYGYAPVTCKIFVVNSLDLASGEPLVEHNFILLQPKASPEWVTFSLGASNPWNKRYPQARMIPSCRWVFKSAQCGYSGVAGTCDKTLARCRELANSARWGGSYGTVSVV